MPKTTSGAPVASKSHAAKTPATLKSKVSASGASGGLSSVLSERQKALNARCSDVALRVATAGSSASAASSTTKSTSSKGGKGVKKLTAIVAAAEPDHPLYDNVEPWSRPESTHAYLPLPAFKPELPTVTFAGAPAPAAAAATDDDDDEEPTMPPVPIPLVAATPPAAEPDWIVDGDADALPDSSSALVGDESPTGAAAEAKPTMCSASAPAPALESCDDDVLAPLLITLHAQIDEMVKATEAGGTSATEAKSPTKKKKGGSGSGGLFAHLAESHKPTPPRGASAWAPVGASAVGLARSLSERLHQLHASQQAQRAQLRTGYQQTGAALQRMQHAALAEASETNEKLSVELHAERASILQMQGEMHNLVTKSVEERTSQLERELRDVSVERDTSVAELTHLRGRLELLERGMSDAVLAAETARNEGRQACEYAEYRMRCRHEEHTAAIDDAAQHAAAQARDAADAECAALRAEIATLEEVSERRSAEVGEAKRAADAAADAAAEKLETANARRDEASARADEASARADDAHAELMRVREDATHLLPTYTDGGRASECAVGSSDVDAYAGGSLSYAPDVGGDLAGSSEPTVGRDYSLWETLLPDVTAPPGGWRALGPPPAVHHPHGIHHPYPGPYPAYPPAAEQPPHYSEWPPSHQHSPSHPHPPPMHAQQASATEAPNSLSSRLGSLLQLGQEGGLAPSSPPPAAGEEAPRVMLPQPVSAAASTARPGSHYLIRSPLKSASPTHRAAARSPHAPNQTMAKGRGRGTTPTGRARDGPTQPRPAAGSASASPARRGGNYTALLEQYMKGQP